MRSLFVGFAAGVACACAAWAAHGRSVVPAAPAPVGTDADPEDASPESTERRALHARLAELAKSHAAPGGFAASDDRPATDADVLRWVLKALQADGPMMRGPEESEQWINALLEWLAAERGVCQADLEFGPMRERLVAAYLAEKGKPLTAEQKRPFEEFMAEAEAAFAAHVAETRDVDVETRLISGLRKTAGWQERLESLLSGEQIALLEDLGVLLDQWRWQPACEPRAVDPKGDLDAALVEARENLNPGDYDRIRGILVDHVNACIAMHREVKRARLVDHKTISDTEEFVQFLEIRAATRKRLRDEGGLRDEAIRNPFLYDYCADTDEDVAEDE